MSGPQRVQMSCIWIVMSGMLVSCVCELSLLEAVRNGDD